MNTSRKLHIVQQEILEIKHYRDRQLHDNNNHTLHCSRMLEKTLLKIAETLRQILMYIEEKDEKRCQTVTVMLQSKNSKNAQEKRMGGAICVHKEEATMKMESEAQRIQDGVSARKPPWIKIAVKHNQMAGFYCVSQPGLNLSVI